MNNGLTISIDTEEELRRLNDVPALCNRADIVISDQTQYETAATVLMQVKSRFKELETQRKEITGPLDEAKKKIMDLFRIPLDLLSKAESLIKSKMIGYTSEQEQKAAEEQKRLQKLAEAEAEKERKKLQARIDRAEANGKNDKAEELKMAAENIQTMVVPVIAPQIETPKGVSFREQWSAEVIDFKLLPDEYKIPNEKVLNKMAQATRGAVSIPGVRFKSEKILSSRG